jgi:hypothetical protein
VLSVSKISPPHILICSSHLFLVSLSQAQPHRRSSRQTQRKANPITAISSLDQEAVDRWLEAGARGLMWSGDILYKLSTRQGNYLCWRVHGLGDKTFQRWAFQQWVHQNRRVISCKNVRQGGLVGMGDSSHMVVKRGEVRAAYCARLAPPVKLPSVLGDRHNIQIPHQHIISPKYGGWRLQAQMPIYRLDI